MWNWETKVVLGDLFKTHTFDPDLKSGTQSEIFLRRFFEFLFNEKKKFCGGFQIFFTNNPAKWIFQIRGGFYPKNPLLAMPLPKVDFT